MKKVIVIGLILLQTSGIYSQINKNSISLELRYPIPIGDNFLHNGSAGSYTGIGDIGIDYSVTNVNNFGVGVLLNSSVLRFSATDLTLMILSPKIKFDYSLHMRRFIVIPQIAIGYSSWIFRAPSMQMTDVSGNLVDSPPYRENMNGLSFKGAVKLVLNSSRKICWYCQVAYEFTRLEKPEDPAVNTEFNRNAQILYPGFGMLWKFGL